MARPTASRRQTNYAEKKAIRKVAASTSKPPRNARQKLIFQGAARARQKISSPAPSVSDLSFFQAVLTPRMTLTAHACLINFLKKRIPDVDACRVQESS